MSLNQTQISPTDVPMLLNQMDTSIGNTQTLLNATNITPNKMHLQWYQCYWIKHKHYLMIPMSLNQMKTSIDDTRVAKSNEAVSLGWKCFEVKWNHPLQVPMLLNETQKSTDDTNIN